jgi:hypothetical protein
MEILHKSNIILHVLTGTVALVLGVIALLTVKGGRFHNKTGRLFLSLISVVIFTGLIGVFVFGRNTFLLVITILSGYVSFSGYRILQSKANTPLLVDIVIAIISILVLGYFIYYFKSIGMIWSPIVIYSTVGALIFVVFYDFLRYFIPTELYKKHKIWLYEHIYKMTSAFAALLSAFAGTVLEEYQPHSQYLPSLVGLIIVIGFMYYVKKYGLKKMRKI